MEDIKLIALVLFWSLLVIAIVAAIPVSILYFTVKMTEEKVSGARAFLEFVCLAVVLSIFLPVFFSVPAAFAAALIFHERRSKASTIKGEESKP